jgi:YggT family protein
MSRAPGSKAGFPCRLRFRPVHVRRSNKTGPRVMLRLLEFIDFLLYLYLIVLFATAILSWLIAFNVVNTRHPIVSMIGEFLYRVTEPALRPIRNFLPNFGPIDISFIVLFLIIIFLRVVVIGNLEDALR